MVIRIAFYNLLKPDVAGKMRKSTKTFNDIRKREREILVFKPEKTKTDLSVIKSKLFNKGRALINEALLKRPTRRQSKPLN